MMTNIHLRRLIILLMIISFMLLLLGFRLAYVQLVAAEQFSSRQVNLIKKAVQQRQEELVLHSGRGIITDRHGQHLTGELKHVLVLFPFSHKVVQSHKLEEIADRLSIPADQLLEQWARINQPVIYRNKGAILFLTEEEAENINHMGVPGVLGLPYEQRYRADQRLASHLLGEVGQNPEWIRMYMADELANGELGESTEVGISGLERTFQPFLQGVGPTTLAYYVDGHGYPVPGLGLKYISQDNPFYPLQIQSTLDAQLQTIVEQTLAELEVSEGAVVLLNSRNSHILAMASEPKARLGSPGDPSWENKALTRYVPGSIFKVVVALAALEEDLVTLQSSHECPGTIPGTSFRCWKEGGHGRITFAEAFYQSCNIVIGELAAQLGPDKLEEYAHQLGLLQSNGWEKERVYHLSSFKQLDSEEHGQLYHPYRSEQERSDQQFLRQTGIGQLDVQLSPLAVANMMATISRGGSKLQVKAVERIEYQTGGHFYTFHDQSLAGPVLSPYGVYQLQYLLRGVVAEGTGRSLEKAPWKVSGKTGTAQVMRDRHDQAKEHHWFAGYFPAEQPRYSLAVVVLNQAEGNSHKALQVVDRLVDKIYQNDEGK